jgi:hypothetical protein
MSQSTSATLMMETADRFRLVASTREGALKYLRNVETNGDSQEDEAWVLVCFDGAPKSVEVFRSEQIVPNVRLGAGHPVQMLCENFPRLITQHGQLPRRVSIYLSRSRSHQGRQTASAARVIDGKQNGAGCTATLIALIRSNPQVISWRIRYDTTFEPGGVDQIVALNNEPNPSILNGHYNVDIRELGRSRDFIFGPSWD